jgi:hypothetical protein
MRYLGFTDQTLELRVKGALGRLADCLAYMTYGNAPYFSRISQQPKRTAVSTQDGEIEGIAEAKQRRVRGWQLTFQIPEHDFDRLGLHTEMLRGAFNPTLGSCARNEV